MVNNSIIWDLLINLKAKFATNYGHFIKKVFEICNLYLEDHPPSDQTLAGKIKLIHHTFFSDGYNQLLNQASSIEETLENYYQKIYTQTKAVRNFINIQDSSVFAQKQELVSFATLSSILKELFIEYKLEKKEEFLLKDLKFDTSNSPLLISSPLLSEKNSLQLHSKERQNCLYVFVHRILLDSDDFQDFSLTIHYGQEKRTIALSSSYVEFETEFSLPNRRKAPRYLEFSVSSQKDSFHSRKEKKSRIDLSTIPANTNVKFVIDLKDELNNKLTRQNLPSEIEFMINLRKSLDSTSDFNQMIDSPQYPTSIPMIIPQLASVAFFLGFSF